MRTGIFFYYQTGERLRDFPEALAGLLEKENVFLYDAYYLSKPPSAFEFDPIPTDMLYQIHSRELVKKVKGTGEFDGALLSASGTVRAAEKIWTGEIDNAFVFVGYGDHHAGTNFFGGGCYFNGAALSIRNLQANFGVKRFAIIDTDAHHGDGTWQIFESNPDVLYVCYCTHSVSDVNNKMNIRVPSRLSDQEYLTFVKNTFVHRVVAFQPDIIFWNWGYDCTQGEYGDMGLTPYFHTSLAKEIKSVADKICNGRLITVLCGGARRDLATYLCPSIIKVLAGGDD